jgi:hypothetical protein
MTLDDRIGELIDRTCGYCGGVIPESSPSADFCGENCQSRWHMGRSLVTRADRHRADVGLFQFATRGIAYTGGGERLQMYHVTTPISVPHSAILDWLGNPAPRFNDPR